MKNLHFKSDGERKTLAPILHGLKVEADADGVFSGYASVFDTIDYMRDIVLPGAFSNSLAKWRKMARLPAMLWQHDPDQPIGKWTEMVEDNVGLRVKGQLALSLPKAREVYEMMKAEVVSGMSIGYRVILRARADKSDTRLLQELDLAEVSVVTMPANNEARINGVKACERFKTIREFENFLRDEGGFSANHAKAIAAGGFKALDPKTRDESGLVPILTALRSVNHRLKP
jgi:HK97 family phage prohead protease